MQKPSRRLLVTAVAALALGGAQVQAQPGPLPGSNFIEIGGAACSSAANTVRIFREGFENANTYDWIITNGGVTGGGFQIGNPQQTSDANGVKQLGSTPSEFRDPRWYIIGPGALVTGAAAGSSATANDLDGSTAQATMDFELPDQRNYIDFYYSFAHSAASGPEDFLSVSIRDLSHHALLAEIFPLGGASGNYQNRNGSWKKKTVDLSAIPRSYGFRNVRAKLVIRAADGGTNNLVEAMVEDVLVYYCK